MKRTVAHYGCLACQWENVDKQQRCRRCFQLNCCECTEERVSTGIHMCFIRKVFAFPSSYTFKVDGIFWTGIQCFSSFIFLILFAWTFLWIRGFFHSFLPFRWESQTEMCTRKNENSFLQRNALVILWLYHTGETNTHTHTCMLYVDMLRGSFKCDRKRKTSMRDMEGTQIEWENYLITFCTRVYKYVIANNTCCLHCKYVE